MLLPWHFCDKLRSYSQPLFYQPRTSWICGFLMLVPDTKWSCLQRMKFLSFPWPYKDEEKSVTVLSMHQKDVPRLWHDLQLKSFFQKCARGRLFTELSCKTITLWRALVSSSLEIPSVTVSRQYHVWCDSCSDSLACLLVLRFVLLILMCPSTFSIFGFVFVVCFQGMTH